MIAIFDAQESIPANGELHKIQRGNLGSVVFTSARHAANAMHVQL